MKAKCLSDLLKKGDRVAVSNITGREASKVSDDSQKYCGNIVAGWALGKGGQDLETAAGKIPVFATFEELMKGLKSRERPNKVIIYSPPGAVYGEVKAVVNHGAKYIETIFIITEHVAIEVTAKIHNICREAGIDVIGCNTLGMINGHDRMRVGAVGGSTPDETFVPGSVTVISNSGNMVNTIASYIKSTGMGTAFGISTGKDALILTPLKDLLVLAEKDPATKIIVLYVEPGGVYEHEAIEMMKKTGFAKPIVVYVAGTIAEKYNISLGHAGAVVEGGKTTASAKLAAFSGYFGGEAFHSEKNYYKSEALKKQLQRGILVQTLHNIPRAVGLVADMLGIKRDMSFTAPLVPNPWFTNLGDLSRHLPAELAMPQGIIPKPYFGQIKQYTQLGASFGRQSMRNSSHASSNDGITPRIYGYSVMDIMKTRSFAASIVLTWTGELPRDEFEERLVEMALIAALTNGPGTISAQGTKLSTSAGNSPNMAMIGSLATIGSVHGGNGAKAVEYLLKIFGHRDINDPYDAKVNVKRIARRVAEDFKKKKLAAKEAAIEYAKIPCLGHPVFRNDPVNYDPREQIIYNYIKSKGKVNIFLEFYHRLVWDLKENGSMPKVMAVNVDAAIACVWLAVCWRHLRAKRMTVERARDIPFVAFALGRAAGGAGEFLDHQDFGTQMDMRISVKDCKELTKARELKA
jgi:succinyl-CoA synthetase alpha subunit